MARFSKFALISIGVLILALFAARAGRAQVNDGGIRTETGNPIKELLERRNREIALRSVTMMGEQKRDPRVQQALLEQMNEDFKKIQLIRLDMVKDIAEGKTFGYKRLAGDSAEVRKRAARLRSSLALLEEKDVGKQDSKKIEFQKDTIQDAASDLCLEISRFTGNPLFNRGAVYNLRYAVEADNTLETIINLSENIKDSADRLRRGN